MVSGPPNKKSAATPRPFPEGQRLSSLIHKVVLTLNRFEDWTCAMLDSLEVFEDVLDITPAPVRRRENVALPAVDILAIATATPEYKTTQAEAFQRVKQRLRQVRPARGHLHGLGHRDALLLRVPRLVRAALTAGKSARWNSSATPCPSSRKLP